MISIKNLNYRYSKKIQLFHGLNLEFEKGKVYGLLGKNGAGKSSLIKNIAGLLFPTTGSCIVNGYLSSKRETGFLQNIFFIPEEVYLPGIPIKELLKTYSPFYPHFNLRQFDTYLEDFGIDASRNLTALSFGQKKKVIIGFALSANTPVLIMDEPTNGLDIPSKVTFRNMIAESFQENRTVIMSTHQVRDLDELIDALVIMDKGEVIFNQDKEAILQTLSFNSSPVPISEPVIYTEKTSGGWAYISERYNTRRSLLDTELLFNALLQHKNMFNHLFKAQK
jgi:ABC-2 type transport system ATP-binding protein